MPISFEFTWNRIKYPIDQKNEYHELAKIVHQEVKRINETIQDFLRFARPEPIRPEKFDLREFINGLFKQSQSLFAQFNISFSSRIDWRGMVCWDKQQMRQVFMNLNQNSVDELQNGGKIELDIQPGENDTLLIQFSDNGNGIPADIRSKIFNLYFTTRARGTGIGLSIVQQIVHEHGGMISIESELNAGTAFTIQMPVKVNNPSSNHSRVESSGRIG